MVMFGPGKAAWSGNGGQKFLSVPVVRQLHVALQQIVF